MKSGVKVRAIWNGETVAESENCAIVEGCYYFPPEDVDAKKLRKSKDRAKCARKGTAHYFDVVVRGRVNTDAAWHYPRPKRYFAEYQGYFAFWRGVEIRVGTGLAARADQVDRMQPNHQDRTPAASAVAQPRLHEFFRKIPKTEIHLHIEGTATPQTIFRLIKKNRLNLAGISSEKDLRSRFQVTNLAEFIELFTEVIQPSVVEEEDFAYLIRDLRAYLRENNIIYSEVFFAPTRFVQNGLSFETMIKTLDWEAEVAEKEDGIRIRYIVDVSRGYGEENAMRNLDLTLEHHVPRVVGIGLGGAEKPNPARTYRDVFRRARTNGLAIVAHAGEEVGPESIWEALMVLGAQRIGHGISAYKDPELMEYLREHQIPLEVCPTSNIFTGAFAKTLADHPIRQLYLEGLNVTVNTDDPSVFSVQLADELTNLCNYSLLTVDQVLDIVQNGFSATFLPEAEKTRLWNEAAAQIKQLRRTQDV